MMIKSLRTFVRRPPVLVAAVALALAAVYQPAVVTFGSAGDVALYAQYAAEALTWPPSLPREYPALSAAIFVVPELLMPASYTLGFALVCAVATAATLVVVERLAARGWLLLALLLLAGWGTLFFRYDIVVVLVTVLAFWCALGRRWGAAQALLAFGVALKLYPVVLMPLVVIAEWRQCRRLPWRSAVAGLVGVAAAVGGTWLAAPAAGAQVVDLLGARPMQFESLGVSLAWLFAPAATELSFGSVNLVSPLAAPARLLMTALSAPALLAAYGMFLRGRITPARAWACALALLIATSKVFSTQYVLWVLPFVALALAEPAESRAGARDDVWLWLLICALSSTVFPFGEQFHSRTAQLAVAALRNGLWLIAAFRLAGLGVPAGVLGRIGRGIAGQARLARRFPIPALALVLGLLAADIVALRGSATRGTLLDVGGWNDEESVRFRGFYHSEVTVEAISYRWSSDSSVLRIRSSAATDAPIDIALSFGGLPQPALTSVVVGLVVDNAATLGLDVPQMPRRFHVFVPPAAAEDGGVASQLTSGTERVGDDSRELGVRVDDIAVAFLSNGIIVPTWQTFAVQLCVLLCAGAATVYVGGRRAQWLVLPVLTLVLALLAGAAVFAPWAWQSRALVLGGGALLVTWGLGWRRQPEGLTFPGG